MLTKKKRTEITIETETVIRVRRNVRCPSCGAELGAGEPPCPTPNPTDDPDREESSR